MGESHEPSNPATAHGSSTEARCLLRVCVGSSPQTSPLPALYSSLLQDFVRQILVVIILIVVIGIGRQLIPGIRHTPTRGSIAYRIADEDLRRGEERMAC